MRSSAALKKLGLEPYRLQPKEGLAIINGTQMMCGVLGRILVRANRLIPTSDISATFSLEALRGSKVPFHPEIMACRPHPGPAVTAANVLRLLAGSEIMESHANCEKVQDPYTLRCIPQVHGAVRDAVGQVTETFIREINSATDNPLVFSRSREIRSGGNFHGQAISMAADTLTTALTSLGNIIERRIDALTNPDVSELPPFLVTNSGLNSGMMVAQIAAAAVAAENRALSFPSSVNNIPTTAGKEDHVSMGAFAVRKCRQVLINIETLVTLELLCAAQGVDFHAPHKPGKGVLAAHKMIRSRVLHLDRDRHLTPDIEAIRTLIRSSEFLAVVQKAAGKLG